MISARQTKIIATLGPATETREAIAGLLDAGVDLFRLNMSHAPHEWARRIVALVRALEAERGRPIGVMMDLQGPAIRTGDLAAPFMLVAGQTFAFTVRGKQSAHPQWAGVNYDDFINDINPGDHILIDNGLIHMKVLEELPDEVRCEVLIGGKLGNRRHINLPGVKVNLPALTEKDHADAQLGLELGVDYFALSFVREAADVAELRRLIPEPALGPRIIAKIEDQCAIKNIDAIISAADAIMVARGDLGVECPYEELPIIQMRLVNACLATGRPVIVATQMLESMVRDPYPTRAEVTDVANAVKEQADAIMLSGETSVGQHPARCVEVAHRVVMRMEREVPAHFQEGVALSSAREKLARAAVALADDLAARSIVVFTVDGETVRRTAWMRPKDALIIAICPNPRLARALTLLRTVVPVVWPLDFAAPAEVTVEKTLRHLRESGHLAVGDTVVLLSSQAALAGMADSIRTRLVA